MIIDIDMDKLIYTIVKDCSDISPPLGRGEITEIAIEQIESQMRKRIKASLKRLVDRGQLAGQARVGATQRYSLASRLKSSEHRMGRQPQDAAPERREIY